MLGRVRKRSGWSMKLTTHILRYGKLGAVPSLSYLHLWHGIYVRIGIFLLFFFFGNLSLGTRCCISSVETRRLFSRLKP